MSLTRPPDNNNNNNNNNNNDNMTPLIIVTIGACVLYSEALSLSQVRVPPFGLGGDKADLGCEYDTQVLLMMESILVSRSFYFKYTG